MSTIQIQRGDTLSKLVAKYNREHGTKLTVAQVAQANGLKDPNKIIAGRQLRFPDQFDRTTPQQQQVTPNTQTTTVNAALPQLPPEVEKVFDQLVDVSAGGDPRAKQALRWELGNVAGENDAQIVASAPLMLRVFYERLRTDAPELADQLLQSMRNVAAKKQQPQQVPSQELLRQQRLSILA